MVAKLDEFVEGVLHCEKTQCPFHQTRAGAYPKFSYGNVQAEVMAVFQNPGQPIDQERRRTIGTVTPKEMRRWANPGVSGWLKKTLGGTSILEYSARPFLASYYITQAYRCPNPIDKKRVKRSEEARRHCSDYLEQEIQIVKPKVILCFGAPALKSVRDILSPRCRTKGIKTLFREKTIFEWCGIRVFPLVHPSGYRRNPSMKERYASTLRWYVDQIEGA